MEITVRKMHSEDWGRVAAIYQEGIDTRIATFQTEVPSYEQWDSGHLKECRLVACQSNKVIGWVALSSVSSRCVYRGVAEVSIYIDKNFRGKSAGSLLLEQVIKESEDLGFWTLQSGIFEENVPSIRLHEKHGFRVIGYREKIGKTNDGEWKNTCLLERRSKRVY